MRQDDALLFVTHELRGPVTVIVGLSETLAQHRHEMTEQQISVAIDQMAQQGRRLSRLIRDLLDLGQLENGRFKVKLGPVALTGAVVSAVEAAPAPETTSLVLSVANDLWVLADGRRLEQVLVNLLTNSYRHGGAAIRLDARRTAEGVLMTVSDDGTGISPDLVPMLFHKFARGSQPASGNGYGLGLAIVRGLVEAFGGQVWYEPGEPRGARFHVLLEEADHLGEQPSARGKAHA